MSDDPKQEYEEQIVKAIILSNRGDIYDSSIHKKIPDDGRTPSQRIIGDDRFKTLSGKIEPLPFNINVFAKTPQLNTRVNRCVNLMATNTVGMGWRIVPKEKPDGATSDEVKEQIEREIELVESLFKKPNKKMNFCTLMKIVKIDQEVTGNGYIEVIRNQHTADDPLGEIVELYHVQSKSVRIRKGGEGFVQIKGGRKRYFKEFGDERVISAATGEEEEEVTLEDRANELLHFMIYDPDSDFYGVPRYLATSPAIAGLRLSAIRNVAFFENDAVPRGLITVTGGSVENEAIDMLRDFFNFKSRGPEHAHRLAILQVDAKRPGFGNTPGKTEINFVPLTVGTTEDASFRQYNKDGNDEIREAWGIAQIFFSEADTPRAGAIAGRAMTNEQVFDPERMEMEFVINETIIDSFGVDLVHLQFVRPEIVDPSEQAKIDQIYARAGALTPNEIRLERLKLKAYPDDVDFGDLPIQLTIVERQLAAQAAQRNEPPPPQVGSVANDPPGGTQDLDREMNREIQEIFSQMKTKYGNDIILKIGEQLYSDALLDMDEYNKHGLDSA